MAGSNILLKSKPRLVGVGALPTAGAGYRGKFWLVEGGAGVQDKIYVCLKAEDDSYHWIPFVFGGIE